MITKTKQKQQQKDYNISMEMNMMIMIIMMIYYTGSTQRGTSTQITYHANRLIKNDVLSVS